MLARQLDGASVLVSEDRYLAGCVAEHHLHSTVHLLDDGFQHFQLDRDVDIVLLGSDDVRHPVTLPSGRLREPLDTLVAADAIVAADDVEVQPDDQDRPVFRARRRIAQPATSKDAGAVVAVAGTAHPERFFDDLRRAGWPVLDTMAFRDHHPYSRRDLDRIAGAAQRAGARAVLTTEKDFVRLLPLRPFPVPIDWVPLIMEPDPLPEFREWLARSLNAARDIVGG
jgi:tetraacyldisaccharide 4'-kinase